jgi:putative ATP-grasp target RiPP
MLATPDPLADPLERFALGRPRNTPPDDGDQPSPVRPFGLRFGTVLQPVTDLDLTDWRLCPHRQVAVTPDGIPEVMDMTMNTSGPSGDGSSGGGAEEWGPDHHDDDRLPA